MARAQNVECSGSQVKVVYKINVTRNTLLDDVLYRYTEKSKRTRVEYVNHIQISIHTDSSLHIYFTQHR